MGKAAKPPVEPSAVERAATLDLALQATPTPQAVIGTPGIYSMPELLYHADPVVQPSLSRSIAKRLIEASPAHAYAEHPRLGGTPPTHLGSSTPEMDVGSAAHAMFLEGRDIVELIPFHSYQSNAAKEARDIALTAGRIPLKPTQYDHAMRILGALQTFRENTGMFREGKPEQTAIWDEGDHWARCRIDWLPDDPALPLLDLKTTGVLATAAVWGKQCFQFGADIQASMYPRGLEFVRGEPPDGMLFVVVEATPPYAIRVFALDPIAVEVGNAKAAAARALWVAGMKTGHWPSYPPEIEWIYPPPWIVSQWETARIGIDRARENPELIAHMVRAGNLGG